MIRKPLIDIFIHIIKVIEMSIKGGWMGGPEFGIQ